MTDSVVGRIVKLEFSTHKAVGSSKDLLLTFKSVRQMVLTLIGVAVPVKHLAICFNKLIRSFGPSRFDLKIMRMAITVSSVDLYYGGMFCEDETTAMCYLLPNRSLSSKEGDIDRALTPLVVIIESFLIYYRFFQALKELNHLRAGAVQAGFLQHFNKLLNMVASGEMTSLIFLDKGIRSLIESHPGVRTVLIPMEGRVWEKLITKRCSEKGIMSIAFLHGALTGEHIRALDRDSWPKEFYPTSIICPGEYFKRLVQKSGLDVDRLYVVPYLRYRDLHLKQNGERLLVVMLTGDKNRSSDILAWLSGLDSQTIKVAVSLNRRAVSYNDLKAKVDEFGFSEWGGEVSRQTVVFTSSISALIEFRRLGVPSALIFNSARTEDIMSPYLDRWLMCGSFNISSSPPSSCEKILESLVHLRFLGDDADFYFKTSIQPVFEARSIIESIEG